MAFGEQTGPPASAKQIRDLLQLLDAAGHSGFRDARGPMGFTQRQAGGKFTRDEAQAFIDQLEQAAEGEGGAAPTPEAVPASRRPAPARRSPAERSLAGVPSDLLGAELQRRGWIVVEP
jgi:hypothetical protein